MANMFRDTRLPIITNTLYIELRLEYHTDKYNHRSLIAYVEENKVCLIVYKNMQLNRNFCNRSRFHLTLMMQFQAANFEMMIYIKIHKMSFLQGHFLM